MNQLFSPHGIHGEREEAGFVETGSIKTPPVKVFLLCDPRCDSFKVALWKKGGSLSFFFNVFFFFFLINRF